MPLCVAAAIAFGSLVTRRAASAQELDFDGRIDRMAEAMASVIPIYADREHMALRTPLTGNELARGRFADGAQTFVLPDAAPRQRLRIRKIELFAAIEQLRTKGISNSV